MTTMMVLEMPVRARRIVLTLPPEEFMALERQAEQHERDVWQEARWLLRRAIAEQQAGERAEADDARPA